MFNSNKKKHIKSKFFFIMDKVEQGEIEIKYLPNEQQLINVNTKPKQGLLFWQDQVMLMNCPIHLSDEMVVEASRGIHQNMSVIIKNGYAVYDVFENPVHAMRDMPTPEPQECVGRQQ